MGMKPLFTWAGVVVAGVALAGCETTNSGGRGTTTPQMMSSNRTLNNQATAWNTQPRSQQPEQPAVLAVTADVPLSPSPATTLPSTSEDVQIPVGYNGAGGIAVVPLISLWALSRIGAAWKISGIALKSCLLLASLLF